MGPKIPYSPNAATAIYFDKVDYWPVALPLVTRDVGSVW